ncbi:MAG: zinc-binding alcohol dehydrogenase [Ardenticatenaceae bacterium]|nr:zinc-binding alcohol dehydrogenase [Ardenticatenaceae bacterium]
MYRLSLLFTQPFQLEIREETLPPLKANQVLVQTHASAISAGTEMLVYRGQLPTDMALDATISSLAGAAQYPLKYGYAAVGRVIELGREVDKSWHGRFVFAFNPHESHFIADPAQLIPLPESLPPQTAVLLPNMETAVSFLMDAQPMIGEQVAVFGQGVVGLLTTHLLAQLPLASLVTLDGYALRRALSQKWGATAVFDPTQPSIQPQLITALQADRPYPAADLTFELSGNPQALDMAIAVTGFNGRLLIGSWYGQKRAHLNLGGHFHRSHMRLISSQVSHINPQWQGRWSKERRLATAVHHLHHLPTTDLITHHLPFTQAPAIYQQLHEAPENIIQIIMNYEL